MSGDLVVREPEHERWLVVYQPMIELAGRLAPSPFVPDGVRGDVAAVFSILLAGHGLGLSPVAALQSITLIKGKPYVSTDVMLGLALRAGHSVQWGACDEKRATVRVTRGDGQGSAEATYTMAQATAAGLAGKDNWRRMPAEMLRARAVRAALRMVAPDIALGIEVAESEQPAVAAGAVTAVQLPQVDPAPPVAEPEPEVVVDLSAVQVEAADVAESRVTPAQMRKIGAMVRQVEAAGGGSMGRDQRRAYISELAGVELVSAKDLTREQASTVIDALTGVLDGMVS